MLLHAALALRDLPPDQRAVWRAMFEHLVFTAPEDAMAHLPPEQRGLLGPPSAERTGEVRGILAQAFSEAAGATRCLASRTRGGFWHEGHSRNVDRRNIGLRSGCRAAGAATEAVQFRRQAAAATPQLPDPATAPALKTIIAGNFGIVNFPVGAAIEHRFHHRRRCRAAHQTLQQHHRGKRDEAGHDLAERLAREPRRRTELRAGRPARRVRAG